MYLGLAAALAVLVWVFSGRVVEVRPDRARDHRQRRDPWGFWLIDLSLAANLLTILIFPGYENFVSRMDLHEEKDRPEWQGEVDFSGLKLKLVALIVAISGLRLLKVFMDVGKYTAEQMRWIIHLVFVISGVLLTAMDWIANNAKAKKKAKALPQC